MGETSAGGQVVRWVRAACYLCRIQRAGYADPWLPFATVFAALVGATAGDWCRRCSAWSTSRNSRLGGPADGEIDENLGTTCPSECAGRCLSFA